METKTNETNLLSLAEASHETPYSAEYLNLLIRRGKLPAKKVGRNWYTSEAALRWYLRRRHLPTRGRLPALVESRMSHDESLQVHQYPKDPGVRGDPIRSPDSRQGYPIMIGSHFSGSIPHHAVGSTWRLILLLLALTTLFVLLFPQLVFGSTGSPQVAMTSPNYRIDESFIGAGGRSQESSTNYQMIETVGDIGTGNSSSANYRLEAGYQPGTQDPRLTFSISTSSLDLGALSTSSVASNSHTMSVLATLTSGFIITALANGPLTHTGNPTYTIPFVADGSVDVGGGDAEYGAQFTGGGGSHPAGDIGLGSTQTVTTYTGSTSVGDTTSVTYKAINSITSAAGAYSSTTTYVATATF